MLVEWGATPSVVGMIVVAIVVALIMRLMHGDMDHVRLRQYIESNGGKLIDATWQPFGPGWAGSDKDRIYLVRYTDKEGASHQAYCRTSGWSGVYFTKDRVEETAGSPMSEADSLREENERLRAELDHLKR